MSTDALAARVDAAVAEVDGVARVFPSGRRVRIAADGSVQVTVSIAVEGDPADVGRRVSDAVRASLPEHPDAEVRVRISRVEPPPFGGIAPPSAGIAPPSGG